MTPLLLVLACAGPPADSADGALDSGVEGGGDSGAADSGGIQPPALPQPDDAVDLDADPAIVHVALEATPWTFVVDGETVNGFAYNRQVPGPTIRAKLGDTVIVDFTNGLPDPTTIHWHGLSVPEAMDGVTWIDAPLAAGAAFTYMFTVSEAGTFWYHPHVDGARQVDLGLYGVFIVSEPDEPAVDQDLVVVWDTSGEHEDADAHEHTAPDPSRVVWTANGAVQPRLELGAGQRARLRMVNVSNSAYLDLAWPGMRQIAADQGFLPALLEPESVVLAPGDRAEFELTPASSFDVVTELYTASGGSALGEALALMEVALPEKQPVPAPTAWPFTGAAVSADPGNTDVIYVFSGGGGDAWLMNGEVYPDITVQTLVLGAAGVIEVRNLSATEHPFHLHGQSFEVLSVNGVAPASRRVEDTVNVGIRGTVRLLVQARNPGDWMAHCHLLPHAEGGMMSVLRVQ